MDRFVVVLSAAGSKDQAEAIARALVERRLAACVQVVPGVCSTFRWDGEVHTESEAVMWIKTRASLAEAVRATIRELHTYDLPEIVELAVDGGDAEYLSWVARETGEAP